jgi:hypothetical protein
MLWARMPEATVYKDGNSGGRKYHIGASTRSWKRGVDAIPQAEFRQRGSQRQFTWSITAASTLHPQTNRMR